MNIPKIIHYIWYQGEHKMPQKYIKHINKWKLLHPAFVFMFWDKKSIKKLTANYSFLKNYWKRQKMISRIDIAKLLILDIYGGVYIDVDIELIKPIDDLLKVSLVLSKYDITTIEYIACYVLNIDGFYRTNINNAFIAASKSHPAIRYAIYSLIPEPIIYTYIMDVTEKGVLTLIRGFENTYGYTYTILDAKYFESNDTSKSIYGIHKHDNNWRVSIKPTTFLIVLLLLIILYCLDSIK